ncbi:MAG: AAA family ATPase [Geodermatophilales bacterium]|nr:AAA family ATPase [Geodermatophilales bacterium]
MLAGREPERAAIAALLDAARRGTGGALVVRGVAGAGKSTLLTDAVAGTEMTVLRTSGVESESPLAFAALQRLLWPLRERLDALPRPQRTALRAALGEAEGEGDRFLAFLGTLSLLADAAEESPILAVVDDAHWLDDASAAALLFVARRLQAERIALLFAARDGDARRFDAGDLPTVVLDGVTGEDADALLSARADGAIDPAVRDRLVETTGGNPLALGELAGAPTGDQLAGRAPLPAQLPLTGGVERAFLDRYRRLDEPAQRFLLVAAADDTGRFTVVRDAADRLDAGDDALDATERAGLLRVDGDAVALYHPLVRSAVYRAATSAQRRAVHRALADALETDPDRRAWHLAAAADRPDETVVAALDGVAERAAARGGHEAAAAAWARAAELTSDPSARARRLSAAAHAAWLAAQPARARSLADTARPLTTDPLLRADLDRLRARVEWNVGSPLVGHRILLRAAAEVAGVDADRARAMTMLAAAVVSFLGEGAEDMEAQAATLGDPATAADARGRCYARLLSGFVHFRQGRFTEAATQFRVAFAEGDPGEDTDLRSNLGIAAAHLGEWDVVLTEHARLLADARERGALVLIVYALTRRAWGEIATGDWVATAAGAAEALDLATSSGQPALTRFPHSWLALLAALRDDRGELADHLAALERLPGAGVTAPIVDDSARWARALTADTAAEALHHLQQLTTSSTRHMAALDRLEAAVRADRPDLARDWADELESFGTAVDAEWALAAAAYGRALLTGGAAAEAEFEQAIKHADATDHRFDQARIHLGYGEHLRRARRRVDARTHLRAALEVFEDLGATRWASRAAQELRASGETARRRDVTTVNELTAQERQVAGLVRQGLSNRDAAARLFVSPRTIDFHLRNVFSKLGVASRAELTALPLEL